MSSFKFQNACLFANLHQEVIINGDSPVPTVVVETAVQPTAILSAEQKLVRKNELKARVSAATSVSVVCAQLPVSSHPNIDSLSNAVIFSFFSSQSISPQIDNEDLKQIDVDDLEEIDLRWQMDMLTTRAKRFLQKTRRNLGDNRATTMGFDMSKNHKEDMSQLQKLVSQLGIYEASLSLEDVNLKFLRSLPSEWKTHTLIWRNKANLKEHSLDDLFNSLRIYEAKVKHSSSPGNPTQNIAFVSSSNTDSTTDLVSAATSVSAICAQLPMSSHLNIDSLSNAIDVDDLEKIDLRWQMAMLTIRARRKGHFARECRSPKDNRRTVATEPQRRHVPVETSTSNALVSQCDGIGSYDWSYQAEEEPAKFALMAIPSSSSVSDNEPSPAKPAQDISHATRPMAPIIEDWVSDSEDESEPNDPQSAPSFVQTFEHAKLSGHSIFLVEASILETTPNSTSLKTKGSRPKNRKTCFVCRGVDHLIKDYNFHAKPKTQPTPRNSAHRGYDKQYASSTKKYPQKHIVPATVITKSKTISVTAARPVSAVVPKIMATKPRHARSLHTKTNSNIIRHKTRSRFSKTSNSFLKVTAAHTKIVSAVEGKKGNGYGGQNKTL
nr:hypothetical protein [Tanacetum cinerariifolium]